jgi:protein-disulfide isomerase
MPKNKLPIIIGATLVLLVLVIAFNYYFQHSIKQVSIEAESSDSETDDSDDLLSLNKKAIEDAGNSAEFRPRPITEDDHIRGELSDPIKILAYLDYSEEFCAELAANLDTLISENEDKILLAARHFPMRSNPSAFEAALALECADEQDMFWDMHDKVFEQIRVGTTSGRMYLNIARELGLDTDEYEECVKNENAKEKIINQMEDANTIGIIGIPTIYINDEIYNGAMPLDDFIDSQELEREGLRSIIARQLDQLRIKN